VIVQSETEAAFNNPGEMRGKRKMQLQLIGSANQSVKDDPM